MFLKMLRHLSIFPIIALLEKRLYTYYSFLFAASIVLCYACHECICLCTVFPLLIFSATDYLMDSSCIMISSEADDKQMEQKRDSSGADDRQMERKRDSCAVQSSTYIRSNQKPAKTQIKLVKKYACKWVFCVCDSIPFSCILCEC